MDCRNHFRTNEPCVLDGGVIDIHFTEFDDSSLWGLKITGDHQTLLNQYFDEKWLTASGEYSSLAGVYFDGTHTYFGVAIPEPSSILLLGSGGAIYGMIRRTKRTSS